MLETLRRAARGLHIGIFVCTVLGALSCGGKLAAVGARRSRPLPMGTTRPPPEDPIEPSRGGSPSLAGPHAVPLQEACAENPLLTACAASTPGASPARTPALATDPAQPSELARVEAVLSERCGSCHGEPSPSRCGTCDGLYEIENLPRMIQTGKVLPCNWQASPLYRRIDEGSMPPASAGQSGPTPAEMNLIGDFVDGLCADLTGGGPRDSERVEIERWLAADCSSCHGPADAADPHATNGREEEWEIATLLETGLVVPCDPDGSLLVQTLRDDSMPPPGVSPRPSQSQLRKLISFIERPCSLR